MWSSMASVGEGQAPPMMRGKQIALILAFVAVAVYWTAFPLRMEILTPRLGIPVIALAGERINAVIKTSLPFFYPAVRWQLRDGENQYPLQELSATGGVATKAFTLKLPAGIGAGAYSLIAETGGGFLEQRKTVHIIDAAPEAFSSETFTIVQLADLPTLGGNESGDRLLEKIITEINIINPNVVLFTGDIAYGGGWEQYRRLADAMARLDAPVIAVAGNHEYEGWAGYLRYFAEPYHSVDYGRYKFISLNSGHGRDQMTQSQFAWLRGQLGLLRDQTPILQIHHSLRHNPGQRGYVHVNADEMVKLFTKYKVPIVLSGHWHGDMVFDEQGAERRDTWRFPGTAYVVTTTAGADLRPQYSASPLHHGYRLIRLKNAALESFTYDYDGDGERDPAASIPVGRLNVVQQGDMSVTVNNELNEFLPNAKISVAVKDAEIQLQPSLGRILRQTRRNGERVIEILADLPANTKTTITLTARAKESGH